MTKGYKSTQILTRFDYGTGHYTQVVWAETDRLGCGMVYYEVGNQTKSQTTSFFQTDDGWFRRLVICNYAVAGNLQGGSMYLQGTACSECPAGTTCDGEYNALCS